MILYLRFGEKSPNEYAIKKYFTTNDLKILPDEIRGFIFKQCPKVNHLEFRVFEERYFDLIFEGITERGYMQDFPIRKISYLCDKEVLAIFIGINNEILNPRIEACSAI